MTMGYGDAFIYRGIDPRSPHRPSKNRTGATRPKMRRNIAKSKRKK